MSLMAWLFGGPEPIGEVKYYKTKSKKWRWKVVDTDGKTVANPIKSYPSKIQAEQSFYDAQAIFESLPVT